jgi:hypothetical protein
MSASTTECTLTLRCVAAGTLYLDNAMLVIGPAPAPYQPLHPQEELARCQRYYEVLGATTQAIYSSGNGGAGVQEGMTIWFAVTKGGIPTATKNGTWNVNNCNQPTIVATGTGSLGLFVTAVAGGLYNYNPNSNDDTVTLEWNP